MRIELHVTSGPAEGQHFSFEQPDCFLFGRVADAHISLPKDPYVSRQHFLLEIAPPECRVTDLNSKNGTVVNGIRYGGRTPLDPGVKQAPEGVKDVLLKDGDNISVGETCLTISIQNAVRSPVKKQSASVLAGPSVPKPAKHQIRCVRCKQDVTDEVGEQRQAAGAEYVCQACREQESFNPLDLFDQLLGTAAIEKSVPGAPSIEGYHIQEMIAKGGMGMIYKAVSKKTGQPVAIKTMLPQVATNPENVQTFQREIDVTRQLKHPHIVRLIEHGKAQGSFYFVLEFVDGMNLEQLIDTEGPLSLKDAAPIMLGTLDGLAYAHRATITTGIAQEEVRTYNGIVHRDLKPQNILLTREGERWFPKITDFGISKSFESAGFTNLTVAGDVLGTPMYWPREQITHYKYLNPATDVFSIAAVFYEMLTGRWVRDGFEALLAECQRNKRFPTIPDYMRVITGNPVIPIRDINPAIPGPVAKLIDRALQEAAIPHNEDKMRNALAKLRYPDAGAFRDALIKAVHEIGASDSVMLTDSYHQNLTSGQQPPNQATPHARQQSGDAGVVQQQKSQGQAWEDIFQDVSDEESPRTGDVLYPLAQTTSPTKEAALFVLDLVQSTQFVLDFGDTYFSTFIGNLHQMALKHASASEMIFIKSTGDGFLAAFNTMSAAFLLASTFLETHAYQDIHIRMALHWGAVKIGPAEDVLGKEVQRIRRIEGVKAEDRIKSTGKEAPLPPVNRVLISRQGMKRLSAAERSKFSPAGTFRLKGFQGGCDLWIFLPEQPTT